MDITIKKYKEIAQVGDLICTNGNDEGLNYMRDDNDDETDEQDWQEMTVAKIASDGFYSNNKDLTNFFISWSNSEAYVEVLKTALPNATEINKVKKSKRKNAYITLEKDAQNMLISIKLPKEIEEYFKKTSKGSTKKSQAWFTEKNEPAEFYLITKELNDIERQVDSTTFSDYGDGLIKGDKINTAILRTCGTTTGVKIKSATFNANNNIDLEYYTKRLGLFIKRLWETSISKKKIKSIISFEI